MKLEWDKTGEHYYETGVDHGVLYVKKDAKTMTSGESEYEAGVAWNGLSNVTESPSGAEESAVYADNIKYLSLRSAENFEGTIEAYTYPDEFGVCDGSVELGAGIKIGQQKRRPFAMAYRTKIGNDVDEDLGYKLHIVYGATAAPAERAYATVNESPEAITMSWSITTTPIAVTGHKPTAHLEIDSTKCDAGVLQKIEDKLFGTADTEPTLLFPDEIATMLTTE